MIDNSNIGDRKFVVECLKRDKITRTYLESVKGALQKIQVSSDLVSENGKAIVRLRIKLPMNGTYAHWFTDESVLRDCERLMRSVLGLRWRYRENADIFEDSVTWQDKEEAVAGAMYEMIMETAGDDVRKLHARVLKILDNRAKSMPDVQAKARDEYAERKKEAIKTEIRRIRKHLGEDVLSEEDILVLWREVLVEEVQEET
jgi:hypothetical protein